jgi:hypothetical protein
MKLSHINNEDDVDDDDDLQTLRAAVKLLLKYLRMRVIFERCCEEEKKAKNKTVVEKADENADEEYRKAERFRKAVVNFTKADGKPHTIKRNYSKLLTAAWLNSPVIPVLRALESRQPLATCQFPPAVKTLTNDQNNQPIDTNIEGRYFLYYGSYVKERHYSIRAMDIKGNADGTLAVTDYINNWHNLGTELIISDGTLNFFDRMPQLLLVPSGSDTKIGFTLMVSNKPLNIVNKQVESIFGRLFSMTIGDVAEPRSFLMVRKKNGDLTEMISQTGAFTLSQLRAKKMTEHKLAFDKLRTLLRQRINVDPMFLYEPSSR